MFRTYRLVQSNSKNLNFEKSVWKKNFDKKAKEEEEVKLSLKLRGAKQLERVERITRHACACVCVCVRVCECV